MNKAQIAALSLTLLTLSGCGLFHADNSYVKATQKPPLEIPDGLDRPNVNDALTIPNVNATPIGMKTDTLSVPGDVKVAYARIGEALNASKVGAIIAHDDAHYTYTVEVGMSMPAPKKRGFFHRMFHWMFHRHHDQSKGPDLSSPLSAGEVAVTVAAGGAGSTVSVTGLDANVTKVTTALQAQLTH